MVLDLTCATQNQFDIGWKEVSFSIEVEDAQLVGIAPIIDWEVENVGTNQNPVLRADDCALSGPVAYIILRDKPSPVRPETWGRTKARYRTR